MPYTTKEERRLLTDYSALPDTPRQLNYSITMLIKQYLARNKGRVSYADYNEVIGVLTCIQHELYRRRISGYEDEKIKINGDVYE